MTIPPVTHVGRNPPMFLLKDRDVMAFMPHTVGKYAFSSGDCNPQDEDGCPPVDAADKVLKLWRRKKDEDAGGTPLYTMDAYPNPLERTLVWYRVSSAGEMVNIPRFVCYINGADPDVAEITPFVEVINPNVVYDRDSNTITMLYWTNVKKEAVDAGDVNFGEPVSKDHIVRIVEKNFDIEDDDYKDCVKALLIAHGSVNHMSALEGFAYPVADPPTGGSEPDLVPLFNQPILVDFWDLEQDDLDGDGDFTNDGMIPILDFVRSGASGGSSVKLVQVESANSGSSSVENIELLPGQTPNYQKIPGAYDVYYLVD